MFLEEIAHSLIPLFWDKSRQDGHRLHSIVGLVGIFGSAILLQLLVPITLIEWIDHLIKALLGIYRIGFVPCDSRQLGKAFKRERVPALLQRLVVDIRAPVTPEPATFTKFYQLVIRPIPNIKYIALNPIVHIVQYGGIARL